MEILFWTSLRGAVEDESWLLLGGSTVHVSSDVTPPASAGKDENDIKWDFPLRFTVCGKESSFTHAWSHFPVRVETVTSPLAAGRNSERQTAEQALFYTEYGFHLRLVWSTRFISCCSTHLSGLLHARQGDDIYKAINEPYPAKTSVIYYSWLY